MLAKWSLHQEYMLNQMAMDRIFLMFNQVGKGSILPSLILASKEWHQQWQTVGVTCPLQQVFFLKLMEETIQRLNKLKFEDPDDPLVNGLRQKMILDKENAWNYLS